MAGGFAVCGAGLVAGAGGGDLEAPDGWNMQNAADDETRSRSKKEIETDEEERVGICFDLTYVL